MKIAPRRLQVAIVLKRDIWMFDTIAGREEIIHRRMSCSEDAAINACQAYVGAQKK